MRMKIVHGFRAGLRLVGVRAPVLSVVGEVKPPSSFLTSPSGSGVPLPDFTGGGLLEISGKGVGGLLSPSFSFTVSRSARSCCFRSFFRSFFARSRSALSAGLTAPLTFASLGVSRPELRALGGGGVDAAGLLVGFMCGGTAFSVAGGAGVPVDFVATVGVAAPLLPAPVVGKGEVAEPGPAVAGVTVRR